MRRLLFALSLCAPLIAAAGCVDVDLGDAPLLCNAGDPPCPKGYACVRYQEVDYCLKEGVDPAQLFRGRADAATRYADGGR